ncbi:hypothetical protein [Comamonas kerstersii]|uniref:DUF7946 domain-containing protein n=1 Tax=Comamonas kerstersii TaxID=225992 RepID=UPI000A733856|nr:hypothetical protein [Comamonas kerstersii]
MKAPIILQFEGHTADEGHLDLYDASESLKGLATTINIITHGFVHNNEVRTKVPKQKDFKTYFSGAKKGCFDFDIDVTFSEKSVNEHGKTVIIARYWDYLSLSIATAVGVEYRPQTPYIKNLLDESPEIFDEMALELESHLIETHRPIRTNNALAAKFIRPHVGEKIVLNQDTLSFISTSIKSETPESWSGNVTRYNLITGVGRAYITEIGRTVPFFIKDFTGSNNHIHRQAAQSMNEGAEQGVRDGGRRLFLGLKTVGNREQIKRIELTDIVDPREL